MFNLYLFRVPPEARSGSALRRMDEPHQAFSLIFDTEYWLTLTAKLNQKLLTNSTTRNLKANLPYYERELTVKENKRFHGTMYLLEQFRCPQYSTVQKVARLQIK